jgi:hypothetical protein
VHLFSTPPGRRISSRRTNRHRAVFVYRAPVDLAEDPRDDADPKSAMATRLSRLRRLEPFSPVGGTALRPLTDAANTVSILREILRGGR